MTSGLAFYISANWRATWCYTQTTWVVGGKALFENALVCNIQLITAHAIGSKPARDTDAVRMRFEHFMRESFRKKYHQTSRNGR